MPNPPPAAHASSGGLAGFARTLAAPLLAIRRFLLAPLKAEANAAEAARRSSALESLVLGLEAAVLHMQGRIDARLDALAQRADMIQQRVDGLLPRMDHMQERVDGLLPRMDGLQDRADGLLPRMDGIQERVDGLLPRMDGFQERVDGLLPRMDGLQERIDGVRPRVDELQGRVELRIDALQSGVETKQDRLQVLIESRADAAQDLAERVRDTTHVTGQIVADVIRSLDRLHGRGDVAQDAADRLRDALEAFAKRQDDHGAVQLYAQRHATESFRRTASALDRTEAALAGFGARFDELDIKVRPLIPYDDASWAVRMREGYALVPRGEPTFATAVANASSNGLEPGVTRVLRALIEPGMGMADVGANVGLLTLVAAFAAGPGGRVWAFEPEARPREQLLKMLHLNGLSWVAPSETAVGAQAGRARFHVSPVIGHSSLHPLPPEEEAQAQLHEVEVTTLDLAIPPDARLDVVKIDVEGAELDVLAGMDRLFADNPDLAVVAEYGPSHLERLGIAPGDWFEAFARRGLTPWLIEEPFGACRPTAPDGADLEGVYSANLAFVRAGGEAESRLPRA